jgi:hypothetical protein
MRSGRLWKSWWRRPRISVRTLMIVVLMFGGGLGWVAHVARLARNQREVVATVTAAGTLAFYDCEYVDGEIDWEAKPPAPQWLLDRVGVDYFYNLVYVWFEGNVTDEFLDRVSHLNRLEELDLRGSTLTDGHWKIIKALPNLRALSLVRVPLTDIDAAQFAYDDGRRAGAPRDVELPRSAGPLRVRPNHRCRAFAFDRADGPDEAAASAPIHDKRAARLREGFEPSSVAGSRRV